MAEDRARRFLMTKKQNHPTSHLFQLLPSHPGAAMLLIHSPMRVGGQISLEMSLDKNELQSAKKRNPVYPIEGSSARASFALKRWFLTSSTLLLPLCQSCPAVMEQVMCCRAQGGLRRAPAHPPISPINTSFNRSNRKLCFL